MATDKQRAKYGAIATGALKAGQMIAQDVGELVERASWDTMLNGAEDVTRIGAGLGGAYTLMKVSDMAEGSHIPKYLRGLPTAVLTTLGVGAVINYFGNDFGMQEGEGILRNTKFVWDNYIDAIKDVLSFDRQTHAGYLMGGLLTLTSAGKFVYNAGKTILNRWDRKSQENKMRESSGME